jgi:hypothetical protein
MRVPGEIKNINCKVSENSLQRRALKTSKGVKHILLAPG